jgi:hypothetical protein
VGKTVGKAEEIPLIFTWIPVLALLSNYDQESCLNNVGTEGGDSPPFVNRKSGFLTGAWPLPHYYPHFFVSTCDHMGSAASKIGRLWHMLRNGYRGSEELGGRRLRLRLG